MYPQLLSWWIWLIVCSNPIIPDTCEEFFVFITKKIPQLCGLSRFANAFKLFPERSDTDEMG